MDKPIKINKMIEDLEGEIWRDIPDYEGYYQVSNMGRVKSFHKKEPRILVPNYDGRGYYCVKLMMGGKNKDPKIHQLVAICFLDHKPDGHNIVIDHINDNSLDNRACNLQLVSSRYNGHKRKLKTTSKYKGVSWSKVMNKWSAGISIDKVPTRLGYFDTEDEAARVYQEALAKLNDPGIIKRYEQ